MQKHQNSFRDSFKYLGEAAKNIKTVGSKIQTVLNTYLPGRLLSKANIFNLTSDITQDLSMMVLLHVEDSLVENNIIIAEKELSVRGLATLGGHEAIRPMSSKGTIKIYMLPTAFMKSPLITFQDLVMKCENNGMSYMALSENIVLTSSSPTYIDVIEGRWVESEIIATGEKLEIIHFDDVNAIDHYQISISVNSETFTRFDSLYDMKSTSKGFILKNGIGNQVDIVFGDGIHGLKLNEGDVINVKHLITSGELGNIGNFEEAKFTVTSGAYDINGNAINLNDDMLMTPERGFVLGSNGENIELTRLVAGYNSRAMVFTRPENLKAFLSRLSIISYVDVWTDLDNSIYQVLMLPNIQSSIYEYRDYLTLVNLSLNDNQKSSIIEYINTSGSQQTSTELLLVDPVFNKYATFVYVSGNIIDKNSFKVKVENALSKVFLDETFIAFDSDGLITQNELIESVMAIGDVIQCNVDVFSEINEIARINGEYIEKTKTSNGSTNSIVDKLVILPPNVNPNLGFDELGGINTKQKNIPILRGGFLKYDIDGNHMMMDKPIYIFLKNPDGIYEMI